MKGKYPMILFLPLLFLRAAFILFLSAAILATLMGGIEGLKVFLTFLFIPQTE